MSRTGDWAIDSANRVLGGEEDFTVLAQVYALIAIAEAIENLADAVKSLESR